MQKTNRARAHQLASDIQKSNNYEANAIKELIEFELEKAREALIDADHDFRVRQGEAQALRKLHARLTHPAPVLRTKE